MGGSTVTTMTPSGQTASRETELARRLRGDVRARARETLDLGRLRTALGWTAEFKADREARATLQAPTVGGRPAGDAVQPNDARYPRGIYPPARIEAAGHARGRRRVSSDTI